MHSRSINHRCSLRTVSSLMLLAVVASVAVQLPAARRRARDRLRNRRRVRQRGRGRIEAGHRHAQGARSSGAGDRLHSWRRLAGGKAYRIWPDSTKQAAEHGYVAATISYRFAPKYLFPGTGRRCQVRVRYLRSVAKERHIDPDKIGAVGMSAGAHLAMMLGTMDTSDGLEGDGGNADQPSKVQAVVSFVGPCNLVGEFPEISTQILAGFVGRPSQRKAGRLQASFADHVRHAATTRRCCSSSAPAIR